MQLQAFLAAVAFSGLSYAIEFTSFPPGVVTAGTPVTVTWTGETAGTPVTILLRQGPSNMLQTVTTLTSNASGGSYTWTPSSSLANGSGYALEIQQVGLTGQDNYSTQFSFTGGSTTPNSFVSQSASAAAPSISASASSVIESISSMASSAIANLTMTTTSSSSTGTASSSHSSTSSSASRTASGTAAPTTGAAASNVQSPLALIMGAAAAMLYFH